MVQGVALVTAEGDDADTMDIDIVGLDKASLPLGSGTSLSASARGGWLENDDIEEF